MWASGAKLAGKANLDHVTGFGTFEEAQDTVGDQAAHRPANGVVADTCAMSEPENGELQAPLSFQAAVAEEMRVDNAVGGGET